MTDDACSEKMSSTEKNVAQPYHPRRVREPYHTLRTEKSVRQAYHPRRKGRPPARPSDPGTARSPAIVIGGHGSVLRLEGSGCVGVTLMVPVVLTPEGASCVGAREAESP